MLTHLNKLFAFVSLLTAAVPAVSNAQVVVHGTYYEEVKSLTCDSSALCSLVFSAVPQDTLISKVNCAVVSHTSTAVLETIQFGVADSATSNPNLRRAEYLPVPTSISAGGFIFYSFLTPSNFLFGSGKYPAIFAQGSANASTLVDCKINGTLQ